MSKRTSNTAMKQALVDVILNGRKAFWLGEESEIFAANSVQQLLDTYGDPDPDYPEEEKGALISADWRYWWNPLCCEKEGRTVGAPAKRKDGSIDEGREVLPMIVAVFGDKDQDCQISTSYN